MTNVLLPIDGSDCSEKSVEWAAKTFSRDDARFHLLYVVEMNEGVRIQVDSYVDAANKALAKAADYLKNQGATVAQTGHTFGHPADEICKYADKEDLDLVVLGSHGRTGLKKLVLGSVSENVLEHCKRPVVIYKNITAK